jgi:hypothetical protein
MYEYNVLKPKFSVGCRIIPFKKGLSHEKGGKIRPWDVSLGPN